jgi:hypothetical protein
MSLRGWILRIDVDTNRNALILSVKCDDGKYRELRIDYKPKLYLTGPLDRLVDIVRANRNYIVDFETERWFLPPWYDTEKDIYVLTLNGPREYYRFLDFFRLEGGWILWNLTPTMEQRFLYENAISVSAYVKIDFYDGRFRAELLEDLGDIVYRDPPFKRIGIRMLDWYGDVMNPWLKGPKWYEIYYESSIIRFRDISSLIDFISDVDPDIIEYVGRYTIEWLSTDPDMKSIFGRRRRIYINYGDNVFEFRDYHGLVELSRLALTDLHRISKYSIGKVLTTIESIEAFRRRRGIPEVRVDIERPKTPNILKFADRGGLYLIPKQGLYWNVAQCDFSSFYPTIIYKYNIGNETVNRPNCSKYIGVPRLNHKICLDIIGIVPISVKYLIDRRLKYKRLYSETGDPVIYSRQNAIKWILVACFGYLGYRNARFGKIEAYECVTFFARDILGRVVDYVRDRGFKVIHALVDSIWIQREDASLEDYRSLCREISMEFGIDMDLDMHYKWIYFPSGRSRYPAPAINRYYGVGYDGSIKVKGIEAVRRDVPNVIKEFQMESISMLADARDMYEFKEIMANKIYPLYIKYLDAIRSGEIEIGDLIITKKLHKDPHEYVNNPTYIVLAKKYGLKVGDVIKYIVLEGGKPILVELWEDGFYYDREYYIRRFCEASKSLPLEYLDGLIKTFLY